MYRGEMTAYYEGAPTPHTLYYYGTGTAGKSEIAPLPENSIAYIKADQTEKKQPTEELLQTPNVISSVDVAQLVQINGDKPFYIPTDFSTQQVRFTKSGTGYQALSLPFSVTEGYVGTITNNYLDTTVKSIPAGLPVVTEGPVNIVANDVMVAASSYMQTQTSYVLDAEGKSVVAADDISPFTYIFTQAFNLDDNGTSLGEELRVKSEEGLARWPEGESQSAAAVYDLSGRKVQENSSFFILHSSLKRGIYIVNGKKIIR
jgi:hypothetical protein